MPLNNSLKNYNSSIEIKEILIRLAEENKQLNESYMKRLDLQSKAITEVQHEIRKLLKHCNLKETE